MTRDPFRRQPEQNPSSNNPDPFASEPDTKKTFWAELGGIVVLTIGFLGYWLYLELQQAPILLSSSPKRTTPSPTKPPASPVPNPRLSGGQVPLPSPIDAAPSTGSKPALNTADEIYQRSPRIGVYYAVNSVLGSSRREIAGGGDRYCLKLVNGAIAQAGIEQQVVISSLSLRSDGIYVDATQEKLDFDRTYTELTDSLGTWQLLENKQDRSGAMAECLATKAPFIRQVENAPSAP